jgi:hypothetical protein
VQAVERMQIDRFLVLQYEGDLHTLNRQLSRSQRTVEHLPTPS